MAANYSMAVIGPVTIPNVTVNGNLNIMTGHLQSNNMYNNDDISANQIQTIMDESPFESYIVTGDLNNNECPRLLNQPKNNYDTTWSSDILDYIIPINYPNMKVITKVSTRDITDVTDHNALMGEIKYI
mgnify:CR=1 FL=1